MQNILIPTNFSLQSLDCVNTLCEQHSGSPLRLVFVHLFKVSDSISDLLMLSRRNKEYSFISDGFYAKCEALKSRHKQLLIKIEFFYGSSMGNFRDFLDANEITAILDPAVCVLEKLNRSSVDPSLFIRKSRVPLVSLQAAKKLPAREIREEALVMEAEMLAG